MKSSGALVAKIIDIDRQLAKMAAERQSVPSGVFVNDLNMPSTREKPPVADKTQAEETEHAEKAEHAPTGPAPD